MVWVNEHMGVQLHVVRDMDSRSHPGSHPGSLACHCLSCLRPWNKGISLFNKYDTHPAPPWGGAVLQLRVPGHPECLNHSLTPDKVLRRTSSPQPVPTSCPWALRGLLGAASWGAAWEERHPQSRSRALHMVRDSCPGLRAFQEPPPRRTDWATDQRETAEQHGLAGQRVDVVFCGPEMDRLGNSVF